MSKRCNEEIHAMIESIIMPKQIGVAHLRARIDFFISFVLPLRNPVRSNLKIIVGLS